MSNHLPSIDFSKVRPLNGRASDGFEELVCQLAALEQRPSTSEYVRKGKGRDAGLECFVRHVDGSEQGWQVKYSWAFDANLKSSLDKSLTAAIKKHPDLRIVTVCLPFDLSDARGKRRTPLADFNVWRSDWVKKVARAGRELEIQLWGQAELLERLTSDDARRSGRVLYWFDTVSLTNEWFESQFSRTRASLGARYTSETNVTLPIRRSLLALTHNPEFLRELVAQRTAVREAANRMLRDCDLDEAQSSIIHRASLVLDAVEQLAGRVWPTEEWREIAEEALRLSEGIYRRYLQGKWEAKADTTLTQPDSQVGAVARKATEVFNALIDQLSDRSWMLASATAALVIGEAGAGKSHLMADACAYQLEKKRPVLMILGGTLQDGEIWPQILEQLALPQGYTRDTLLGALDAAGEAAGVRMLLCIDAINERHGRHVWPDRLSSFLQDVSRFPNVALILSCRSTYLRMVVPADLDEETLPRLEHIGFSNSDARSYLKLRGIFLPDHPFLEKELRNPLFLKTCCDALDRKKETRFPKGLRGVSAVFSMFRSAVCEMLEYRLGLNPHRRIPDSAITALAQEISATQDPYILFDRAAEIVDPLSSGSGGFDGDLLFSLESEGVIAIEPLRVNDKEIDHVRFTFERFGDYTAAAAILEDTLEKAALPDPLRPDTALVQACTAKKTPWGVIEALAVQLPERTGAELPDVIKPFSNDAVWRSVSPETVGLRSPQSITGRTLELLDRDYGAEAVLDMRVRLSLVTSSDFNADAFHRMLSVQSMPERDAGWSIYVAHAAGDSDGEPNSPLNDLIEWAMGARLGSVDMITAQAGAITLTWCLSTSSRRARDRTTKALVALIIAEPLCGRSLLELFENVDEPYIGERLAAAIYGAALQSAWNNEQLADLAQDVGKRFFINGALPLDMLWRDHLTSLIRYAESRGCAHIPKNVPTHAPFESPWPLEPVSDKQIESYTRTHRGGHTIRDEIVSSTGDHGDFARYTMKSALRGWASAPRGTNPLPTQENQYWAWKSEFDGYANSRMQTLFDQMDQVRADSNEWMYAGGEPAERHRELEKQFESELETERFERYRAMARYWRPGNERRSAISHPAEFDLPWARRWVCNRAHELGWAENLHGAFDLECGHDRHNHMHERIGKKYQWIALRELMARISDHCEAVDGDWAARYTETIHQLRDIDPSHLIDGTHDWGWASFQDPTFWMPYLLKPAAMPVEEAWDWLDSDEDFLDGPAHIELAPDSGGRQWLPLSGFQLSRQIGTTQATAHIQRETWQRLKCFVVRLADASAAIAHLEGQLFLDFAALDFGEDGLTDIFLGEHGWRNASYLGWTLSWGGRWDAPPTVEARATTCSLLQESGLYDLSLRQNIAVELPAPWLVRKLDLRLADGRDVSYVDPKGQVIYFDPSVKIKGPSMALVDRAAFIETCVQDDLCPIWVVAGEKAVFVEGGETFGRREFTSVWTIGPDGVEQRLHKSHNESLRTKRDQNDQVL